METSIKHDEERSRFDLFADGKEGGLLTYEIYDGVLDIQHTVVKSEFRGKGFGELLLAAAVEYAGKKGLKVKPSCSFARKKLSS